MEKRTGRVSEAQWSILIEFLGCHPNLARARGYNNCARGIAESLRLWKEVALLLNAEGSGTTKTPKDWSIYVSNYKSKLKKILADINADASGTGGFGQTAHGVRVEPFPNEVQHQLQPQVPQTVVGSAEHVEYFEDIEVENSLLAEIDVRDRSPIVSASHGPPDAEAPDLPLATRQSRYRSRPLAPLDEARRILSQVEMQRAAADSATARALDLIAKNLGRLADAAENLFLA